MNQTGRSAASEAPLARADSNALDRRVAVLLFLLMLAAYGVTNRGAIWFSDGAMRLGMARHLVETGQTGVPDELVVHLGVHGGKPVWGIGHSLALMPSVLVGKAAAAVTGDTGGDIEQLVSEAAATGSSAVFGAIACAALYLTGRRLRFSRTASALAAIGLGLGTPWWVYTQTAFYEPLQGLCVLGALLFALQYREHGSPLMAVLSGACLGFAILTKLTNAAMLLPLAALVWPSGRSEKVAQPGLLKTGLYLAAGLAPFVAMQIWADSSIFGTPFPGPLDRHPKYAQAFAEGNLLAGLWFVFAGSREGLAWYSPATLAALCWFGALWRRDTQFGLAAIIATAIGLLMSAKVARLGLDGGCWGYRFLVPVLPLMALGFLPWFEQAGVKGNSLLRRATILLFVWAVGVQWVGTTIHYSRYHNEMRSLPAGMSRGFPYSSPLVRQVHYLTDALAGMAAGTPHQMVGKAHDVRTEDELLARSRSLNVLNYWWVLAYYEGLPVWLIAAALAALVVLGVFSLGQLARLTREARWRGRQALLDELLD